MRVITHSNEVRPGELEVEYAVRIAEEAGMTELVLSRNGLWLASDDNGGQYRLTPNGLVEI